MLGAGCGEPIANTPHDGEHGIGLRTPVVVDNAI